MPTFALFSWPIIAIGIFAALGPARGLIWSTVVGYLFLPPNFGLDLPGLPNFDKEASVALAALLGCVLFKGKAEDTDQDKRLSGHYRFATFLACLIVLSPILTVATNRESLIGGILPGLGFRDLISMTSSSLILLVPFFLARRFLTTPAHHRELLLAVALGGFVYTFLILFEARMSPQLNQWVYGYFQHVWAQHIRGGGWRAIVFLNHGLAVGFFLFSALIATVVLFRLDGGKRRPQYILLAVWLLILIPISRNLGALIIALLLLPVALSYGRKVQIWCAMAIAVLFLSFPLTRQMDIFPIDQTLAIAERIDSSRASSFGHRVENEDAFLERALQKPVFGWGIWGRWRIYDEFGRDVSTSDGRWVSVLGERGWVGYLSLFGLLAWPMLSLGRAAKRRELHAPTVGLVLIMAGNLLYLIPNSTISPVAWLMVGALVRFVETVPKRAHDGSEQRDVDPEPERRELRYTRFEGGSSPEGYTRTH